MLIPVAWYYFLEIFRSYSINHHSHQDTFIDNPAQKLTRDWIFDLKKGSCTWPDCACMEVDVSVYCRLRSSPSGKIDGRHYLAPSWLSLILFSMKKYCIEFYGECYQKYIQGNHCYKRN